MDHVIPVTPIRFVLAHYHIFKNAGTTIEYILERVFGAGFRTIHGPEPDSVLTGADLALFLAAHPDVLSVSSHHLKYPVPEIERTSIIDCCFLRDPMQRIWSMYKYLRRVDSGDQLSAHAKGKDLPAFVELLMREHPHMVNDVQVNIISNRGEYLRPPHRADLDRASNILDRIAMLGVVDLFDESLTAAEHYLQPGFGLRFEYVEQNSSHSDEENRISPDVRFRELVGLRLYEQLMSLNSLDAELVDRARGEVMRRFRMVPDSEARLADFRVRCQTLQAS